MDVRGAIGAFALFALALGVPRHAVGEVGVGVVTALSGEATIARARLTQPLAVRTRDDVLTHDRIMTRERSLVHVLLRNRALVTVRELSVLTVTEGAARATTDLESGKVGLAVARQLMRPGEVIEIQTPNVLVAVRGTVLVVEILPSASRPQPASSAAVMTTKVYLLHGSVDVSLRNDPTAAPVHLKSLQVVEISHNTFGPIRSLSPEAAAAATSGLIANELSRPGPPAEFLSALVTRQHALGGAVGALPRVGGVTGATATNAILSGASVSTLPLISGPTDLLTGN